VAGKIICAAMFNIFLHKHYTSFHTKLGVHVPLWARKMFVSQEINYSMCIFSASQQVMPQVTFFIFSAMNPFIAKKKKSHLLSFMTHQN
jgi:hypothetical protein